MSETVQDPNNPPPRYVPCSKCGREATLVQIEVSLNPLINHPDRFLRRRVHYCHTHILGRVPGRSNTAELYPYLLND